MIWTIVFLTKVWLVATLLTPLWLVWAWIYNGFSFRRTREYLAFCKAIRKEREAEKERESQKQRTEYLRKRKEQLGW